MLRIRREQMEALGAPFLDAFVARTLVHVESAFPKQRAALGEEGARALVHHALARAAHHGFTRDEDVVAFVSFTVVFGRGFDELEWAREVLDRPDEPAVRMAHLKTRALLHEGVDAG